MTTRMFHIQFLSIFTHAPASRADGSGREDLKKYMATRGSISLSALNRSVRPEVPATVAHLPFSRHGNTFHSRFGRGLAWGRWLPRPAWPESPGCRCCRWPCEELKGSRLPHSRALCDLAAPERMPGCVFYASGRSVDGRPWEAGPCANQPGAKLWRVISAKRAECTRPFPAWF